MFIKIPIMGSSGQEVKIEYCGKFKIEFNDIRSLGHQNRDGKQKL